MNLQDAILKEIVDKRVPVTLYLMNGFQMRGHITAYDCFVVIMVTDEKMKMIYKHAISTVEPVKPLAVQHE